MKGRFEGLYFKQVRGGDFLALIPGRAADCAFIQVLTRGGAHFVRFPASDYRRDRRRSEVRVGDNVFSRGGVRVDLDKQGVRARVDLTYEGLTPLTSDIMGPFRFLPMECRHKVVSMGHGVDGEAEICGERLDFRGGRGYIEGDSGRSFPSAYTWLQCNDLGADTSVMASVARIPFAGRTFSGCICAIVHEGRQYRLATYRGVKILRNTRRGLTLRQGKYLFEADVTESEGRALFSPLVGSMTRMIKEAPQCGARIRFSRGGEMIFDKTSLAASFEFAT